MISTLAGSAETAVRTTPGNSLAGTADATASIPAKALRLSLTPKLEKTWLTIAPVWVGLARIASLTAVASSAGSVSAMVLPGDNWEATNWFADELGTGVAWTRLAKAMSRAKPIAKEHAQLFAGSFIILTIIMVIMKYGRLLQA